MWPRATTRRDDAVDVLSVGAPDVQRVRHPERAAVPGQVRPGPRGGERRVRAERERARAAHRGHHRDAVRTGAARGAERAGDIRQDGVRIDSAGLGG